MPTVTHSISVDKNEKYRVEDLFLPNRKEIRRQFYGLKDQWWRQIIDGRFHQYGKLVFDKGLNNKDKIEPGYWQSIKRACQILTPEFDQPLNLELYKKIHAAACSHFSRDEIHDSECNLRAIKNFRHQIVQCSAPICHLKIQHIHEQEENLSEIKKLVFLSSRNNSSSQNYRQYFLPIFFL